ncbi:hypothetical protein NDU88_004207 [Pleurodeles waltl]|uniref:Collagen alpha-1(I) chain-like n=1 Tax=Pleurodeles waltl TaxID=8319 RepID=A0AAV7W9P3_PLEWA|nr:hypothetical protein NDU88_004207 [Pleurodeles waltl]
MHIHSKTPVLCGRCPCCLEVVSPGRAGGTGRAGGAPEQRGRGTQQAPADASRGDRPPARTSGPPAGTRPWEGGGSDCPVQGVGAPGPGGVWGANGLGAPGGARTASLSPPSAAPVGLRPPRVCAPRGGSAPPEDGSGKRGSAVTSRRSPLGCREPAAADWASAALPVPPSDLGCDRRRGSPSKIPAACAVTLPSGGPGYCQPMCAHDPDSHIRIAWRLGAVPRAKPRSPRHPHIGPGRTRQRLHPAQQPPVFTPIPGAPHTSARTHSLHRRGTLSVA